MSSGDPLPNRTDQNGRKESQSSHNTKRAPLVVKKNDNLDEPDVDANESHHPSEEM